MIAAWPISINSKASCWKTCDFPAALTRQPVAEIAMLGRKYTEKRNPGKKGNVTHGGCYTQVYDLWRTIKNRCTNTCHPSYERYHELGVKLSDEFQDFVVFREYVENELGHRPSAEYSIDRIDNEKGYERGNLKWSTDKEQARNRRDNLIVLWAGRDRSLAEAAELAGIPYKTAWERLQRYGWPLEKALTQPVSQARSAGRKAAWTRKRLGAANGK